MTKILAIESSCDETSAAVLTNQNGRIDVLSNITATSLSMHAATGGIIPENAARMQVKFIIPVIVRAVLAAFKKVETDSENDWKVAAKIIEENIDSIAVTFGPGLIGSLLVGVETAKTLSFAFNKPLIPVNHLLAHIYANFISNNRQSSIINHPFIGLIVSGGHTDLLYFMSHKDYKWLGGTRDDAAGEAMDKIGRLLGLPYPAGPEIERRAKLFLGSNQKQTIKFKSPLINSDDFDFSFSGLKTEVLRFVNGNIKKGVASGGGPPSSTRSEALAKRGLSEGGRATPKPHKNINEICYATQKAIIDVLAKKTLEAAEKYNCKAILVGGGVSANQALKNKLESEVRSQKLDANIFFPEKEYSMDNAAMIGAYALLNYETKPWQEVNASPELYFE